MLHKSQSEICQLFFVQKRTKIPVNVFKKSLFKIWLGDITKNKHFKQTKACIVVIRLYTFMIYKICTKHQKKLPFLHKKEKVLPVTYNKLAHNC